MDPRDDGARPARNGSGLLRVAVGAFLGGMGALLVVFGLHLLGYRDLPSWLSIGAIAATSIGFGLGLVALLREARTPPVTGMGLQRPGA